MSDYHVPTSETYVSFCKVEEKYSSRTDKLYTVLNPLADVTDGKLKMRANDGTNAPPLGRFWILGADGKKGEYGVWKWSFSLKDGERGKFNYVSERLTGFQPIPIWIVPGCHSIDDLREMLLTRGISDNIPPIITSLWNGSTVLIGVVTNAGYDCFVCSFSDLTFKNNNFFFADDVFCRPRCTIPKNDQINLDGQIYYRYLEPPINSAMTWIRCPNDAVLYILKRRMTAEELKKLDIAQSRKDAQRFRSFVEKIETRTLYQELSSIANIDEEESKRYFDGFHKYLDKSLISDLEWMRELLLKSYGQIPEIQERINGQLYLKWQHDARKSLNEELDKLKSQYARETEVEKQKHQRDLDEIRQSEKQLSEINEKIADAKKDLESVNRMLDEANKVLDGVLTGLADAKKDTVAFIKTVFPFWTVSLLTREQNTEKDTVSAIYPGPVVSLDAKRNGYTGYKDAISTIGGNLKSAGVVKKRCSTLAHLLYAACNVELPVFLAGPNGEAIADAFSAGVVGENALRLDGKIPFTCDRLEELDRYRGKVLLIQSPLSQDWCEHLQEMAERGVNIIAVHPYREDLEVLPKGLFNHCLPLFSELFIDSLPKRDFTYRTNSLPLSDPAETSFDDQGSCEGLLDVTGAGPLAKRRLLALLKRFSSLKEPPHMQPDYFLATVTLGWLTARRKKTFKKSCEKVVRTDFVNEIFSVLGLVDER